MSEKPEISIIVTTYNRANTIERCLDSILNQEFPNYEILLIDDGSTDNTQEIIRKYEDSRLVKIKHPINRGVTAAKNTGLNNIHGEWFTFVDSDDEILPDSLMELFNIVSAYNGNLDAISCNCIDSITGSFTGKGMDKDQLFDFETKLNCSGDFWGITKTNLLGHNRFNENIHGYEDILWFKIYEKARRYYLHKGLLIYHKEGEDRISVKIKSLAEKNRDFIEFYKEKDYLRILKNYRPKQYLIRCCQGIIVNRIYSGDKFFVRFWRKEMYSVKFSLFYKLGVMVVSYFILLLPKGLVRGLYSQLSGKIISKLKHVVD